MVKKKSEGVEALIKPPVPDIQEITLLDWYAAFALFTAPQTLAPDEKVTYAFNTAEHMLAERKNHV